MPIHQSNPPSTSGADESGVDVSDIMNVLAQLESSKSNHRFHPQNDPTIPAATSASDPSVLESSASASESSLCFSQTPSVSNRSLGSLSSSSPSTSRPSCFSSSENASTNPTTQVSEGADAPTDASSRNGNHPPNANDRPQLTCEFARFNDCEATFELDNKEEWITHIAEHLGYNYPPKCICWWCDDCQFFTASERQVDREKNFHLRMDHIAEHCRQPSFENQPTRPDFFMIKFLLDGKLVGQAVRARLEEWNEYQIPSCFLDNLTQPKPPRPAVSVTVAAMSRGGRRERARVYHS